MPSKRHIISNTHPYHVSCRTNNKEWFDLPMDDVWNIMTNYLYFIHKGFNVRIHCFVLMSNHFHMLISTPEGNLSQAMCYFMRETSRSISIDTGRINHNYGQRFHRSLITGEHNLVNVYKYIYHNPVKAGLVSNAEQYRYSTLYYKLGNEHSIVPFEFDETLFKTSITNTLDWINCSPNEDDWNSLKSALKRKEFKLSVDRKSRTPNNLESYRL